MGAGSWGISPVLNIQQAILNNDRSESDDYNQTYKKNKGKYSDTKIKQKTSEREKDFNGEIEDILIKISKESLEIQEQYCKVLDAIHRKPIVNQTKNSLFKRFLEFLKNKLK